MLLPGLDFILNNFHRQGSRSAAPFDSGCQGGFRGEQDGILIMVWSGSNVLNSSIFGVLDKANPIVLPSISDRGHWDSYRAIREDRFKFAAEAKKSIAERGYYLIGGEINVTETEGPPIDPR